MGEVIKGLSLICLLILMAITRTTDVATPNYRRLAGFDLIQNANFEPSATELSKYGLPSRMIEAVPLLDMPGRCSGFYVSNHGHLLTAGHCIYGCLEKANLIDHSSGTSRAKREDLTKANCHITINGQPADAEVLAVSDCTKYEEYLGGSCRREDYALLLVRSKTPTTCLDLNHSKLAYETTVASIGYPRNTLRAPWKRYAKDSDGRQQFISVGKVVAPMPFCRILRDGRGFRVSGRHYFRDDKYTKDFLEGVLSGDYIQTLGAELIGGSSGGPLIDLRSASVVGIASFVIDKTVQNDYDECAGSTIYTAIPPTVEAIKKNFPSVDLGQAFDCQNPVRPGKLPALQRF